MRHRKTLLVITFLASAAVVFIRCGSDRGSKDPRGPVFAGSASCVTCHKNVVDDYAHANHYKTSSRVSVDSLRKYAAVQHHSFTFPGTGTVNIVQDHEAFLQSWTKDGQNIRSEPMQVAFGSGAKAQTFAYWKENELRQLPLTFYNYMQSWSNSPGYRPDRPDFDRILISGCMECHSSNVKVDIEQSGPMQTVQKMDSSTIIFGIDCERCHGPSIDHVRWQTENPQETKARFITSIKSLPRERQLDLCATCHSGTDQDIQRSLFGFKPGDSLSRYFLASYGSGNQLDVHGKQMQLLRSSKCFRMSQMTCGSCHSPHNDEKNQARVFTTRCMTCHAQLPHAIEKKMQSDDSFVQGVTSETCITCHMPLQASRIIDVDQRAGEKSIQYMLRTHRIAVYANEKAAVTKNVKAATVIKK